MFKSIKKHRKKISNVIVYLMNIIHLVLLFIPAFSSQKYNDSVYYLILIAVLLNLFLLIINSNTNLINKQ